MPKYMLAVHTVVDRPSEPMNDEQMQELMARVGVLEAEMKSAGAFVFSGAMHDVESATVVRVEDGGVLHTDGPFAEAKEHLGGFYIVETDDLDAALGWATKVTETVQRPIEVRPFRHAEAA